ncbi:MAG: SDR family oxidoreductase [Gemmatimonadetes bacterium]|nr:SDR family oxidoreductase [Gemmatimonadota bacterium]NNL31222.1 SDR family oxidoreductase [Gemmatimonadota bacterium]
MSERVALVTGGSRGIGAAIAHELAKAGAMVIVTHRDSEEGAREVVASLPGEGHRYRQASASDTRALNALATDVAATEGRLDVLVNNAATTRVIPHHDLEALDDTFFDRIMQTNVRGPFATIRAFRALLDRDGGGVVVNISSLASRMGNGSNVAYCASKAALDNMTTSLARALAPNVRVLSVAPGLVDTELTRGWDPERRQHMLDSTPLGRLATVGDVASAVMAAVVSLPSTTGVSIPVDGGRPLGG